MTISGFGQNISINCWYTIFTVIYYLLRILLKLKMKLKRDFIFVKQNLKLIFIVINNNEVTEMGASQSSYCNGMTDEDMLHYTKMYFTINKMIDILLDYENQVIQELSPPEKFMIDLHQLVPDLIYNSPSQITLTLFRPQPKVIGIRGGRPIVIGYTILNKYNDFLLRQIPIIPDKNTKIEISSEIRNELVKILGHLLEYITNSCGHVGLNVELEKQYVEETSVQPSPASSMARSPDEMDIDQREMDIDTDPDSIIDINTGEITHPNIDRPMSRTPTPRIDLDPRFNNELVQELTSKLAQSHRLPSKDYHLPLHSSLADRPPWR